jgi:hypothetical protein
MGRGVGRRVRVQKDVKKPTRRRSGLASFGRFRLTRACSARRGGCSSVNDKRRLPGVTILVNKRGQSAAYPYGFDSHLGQSAGEV